MDTADLETLKGLKKLAKLEVSFATMDPVLMDAFDLFFKESNSKAETVSHLNKLVAYADKHSPVGRVVLLQYLILHAVSRRILEEVIEVLKPLGSHHEIDEFIFAHVSTMGGCLVEPGVIKWLIQLGTDFGALYPPEPKSDEIIQSRLEEIVSWLAPTVEVFQLLFEAKLANNNTMTVFEHAKLLHPDYPFFWEYPLFMAVLMANRQNGPNSV